VSFPGTDLALYYEVIIIEAKSSHSTFPLRALTHQVPESKSGDLIFQKRSVPHQSLVTHLRRRLGFVRYGDKTGTGCPSLGERSPPPQTTPPTLALSHPTSVLPSSQTRASLLSPSLAARLIATTASTSLPPPRPHTGSPCRPTMRRPAQRPLPRRPTLGRYRHAKAHRSHRRA